MPELPEVETVVRGLKKSLIGHRIKNILLRRDGLRFPFPRDFSKILQGRRLEDVSRRAKYIIIHLDNDLRWLCHLGMSGSLVIQMKAPHSYQKHDHVIMETEEGAWLIYNDARRFGMMDLVTSENWDNHPLLKNLGPEPLAAGFDATRLSGLLKGKEVSIKAALLDQRLMVGVGNIYASEALFRAGIRPTRRAGSLTKEEVKLLTLSIKEVLKEAIKAGGSSLRNYVQANGELGYFQAKWQVYGKEGQTCPGCICQGQKKGGIKRIEQSGRSSFFCPQKQK